VSLLLVLLESTIFCSRIKLLINIQTPNDDAFRIFYRWCKTSIIAPSVPTHSSIKVGKLRQFDEYPEND